MNEEECLSPIDVRFARDCRVLDHRTTDRFGVISSLIVEREETNRSVPFRCTTKRSLPIPSDRTLETILGATNGCRSDGRRECPFQPYPGHNSALTSTFGLICLSSIVHHRFGQSQRRRRTILQSSFIADRGDQTHVLLHLISSHLIGQDRTGQERIVSTRAESPLDAVRPMEKIWT